jgi:hypothetical protein
MATVNPQKITWSAPTQNTDGTPIVESLNYRLVVDGVDFLDFPGTLNPDGKFEQELAPLNLPANQVLTLALKAFYGVGDQPGLVSAPSGSIEVILGVAAPEAPFGLAAE